MPPIAVIHEKGLVLRAKFPVLIARRVSEGFLMKWQGEDPRSRVGREEAHDFR